MRAAGHHSLDVKLRSPAAKNACPSWAPSLTAASTLRLCPDRQRHVGAARGRAAHLVCSGAQPESREQASFCTILGLDCRCLGLYFVQRFSTLARLPRSAPCRGSPLAYPAVNADHVTLNQACQLHDPPHAPAPTGSTSVTFPPLVAASAAGVAATSRWRGQPAVGAGSGAPADHRAVRQRAKHAGPGALRRAARGLSTAGSGGGGGAAPAGRRLTIHPSCMRLPSIACAGRAVGGPLGPLGQRRAEGSAQPRLARK